MPNLLDSVKTRLPFWSLDSSANITFFSNKSEDAISALQSDLRDVDVGDDPDDDLLKFVARRTPLGNRICYGVARDLLENWFTIVDNKNEEPIDALNLALDDFAEQTRLKRVLSHLIFSERWAGYAIVVDWDQFQSDEGGKFKTPFRLEAFNKKQIDTIHWDEQKGIPVFYSVIKKLGEKDRKIKVPANICYHLSTRGDFIEGDSALLPVYYDLIVTYNLAWGVGQTFYRYGTGFPVYRHKGKMSATEKSNIISKFEKFHTLEGMVIEGEGNELSFEGMTGKALDPEPYMGVMMKRISAGTSIPTPILEGSPAGALVSGQTNQSDYYKFLQGEQSLVEYLIRQILVQSAQFPEDGWKMQWNDPQPSKLEQLQIEELELDLEEQRKRIEQGLVEEPDQVENEEEEES